ncbi:MAG: TRAP transporter small permease [Dehalococcoidia bacterium]|jgi:TRAP-type C4-dicarboxylate transport system permease small subunit|nr:TRAP transporter small permease [Dehalococcoidia bacterium]
MVTSVVTGIVRALKVACTVLMATFVVIVLTAVFFRYVVNDSLTWGEQVARYLFIWMIMLGMPILYHEKANVCFDMLVTKVPAMGRRVIGVVLDGLVVAFGVFMSVQAFAYIEKAGANILEGLGIPQWMVYVAQPIGGLLLAVVALESAVLGVVSLRQAREPAGRSQG